MPRAISPSPAVYGSCMEHHLRPDQLQRIIGNLDRLVAVGRVTEAEAAQLRDDDPSVVQAAARAISRRHAAEAEHRRRPDDPA